MELPFLFIDGGHGMCRMLIGLQKRCMNGVIERIDRRKREYCPKKRKEIA
jgi:hypothetical protein